MNECENLSCIVYFHFLLYTLFSSYLHTMTHCIPNILGWLLIVVALRIPSLYRLHTLLQHLSFQIDQRDTGTTRAYVNTYKERFGHGELSEVLSIVFKQR